MGSLTETSEQRHLSCFPDLVYDIRVHLFSIRVSPSLTLFRIELSQILPRLMQSCLELEDVVLIRVPVLTCRRILRQRGKRMMGSTFFSLSLELLSEISRLSLFRCLINLTRALMKYVSGLDVDL